MARRRRRRNWSDDEKRMICAQTRVRGVSVSQVARRYDVNANQVFNWLKEARFADAEPLETEAVFLPVTIDRPDPLPAPLAPPSSPPSGRIEIELSGGHRISAEGGFDPDVLARLLKGLIG